MGDNLQRKNKPAAKKNGSAGGLAVPDPEPWVANTRFVVLVTLVAALFYFDEAPQHVLRTRDSKAWRARSPVVPTFLDILSPPKLKKFRIKRDGGLDVELEIAMRMNNKLPAPLKVRGMNMTALFRTLGGDDVYDAGYQSIGPFTAPPFGSVNITARYVLNDLRVTMVGALVLDVIKAFIADREAPKLVTKSIGQMTLWPFLKMPMDCSLTSPLGAAFPTPVVNSCRVRLF